MNPARSASARSTIPTVAVITAHTKIFPRCARARSNPSRNDASSPSSRFIAVPITAALKKIVTNASAT